MQVRSAIFYPMPGVSRYGSMTRAACDVILRIMELLYFAYGSNMSTRRLQARVPRARPIEAASLAGRRLAWHKQGRDGSGKCDIPAVHPEDVVYGVVFSIDDAHKPRLDEAEGLGWGYEQMEVDVYLLKQARTIRAFTYYAIRTDPSYIPYDWYRDHVLIGAREHGLPARYVRMIENVPVFEDLDDGRARLERALYETDPGRASQSR